MADTHTLKERLMIFLKGWHDGAGHRAIKYEDDADYMLGYVRGRTAYSDAVIEAQKMYGAKLSILRVQDTEEHKHG